MQRKSLSFLPIILGIILGVFVFSSHTAEAAITRIQTGKNNCITAVNCSATIASSTAGNFIVVEITMRDDLGETVPSVTDNKGNAYTTTWNVNDGHYIDALFYAANVAGGVTSVTANIPSGGSDTAVIVAEYSGITSVSAYDVGSAPSSQNGTSTSPYSSLPVTTTQADELLVGYVLNMLNTNVAFTGTNGWTAVTTQNAANNGHTLGFQERIVASIGSYANTGTSTQSVNYAAIATFKGGNPRATPPIISSVASSTAAITATITWTTDENASSTVNYGLTSSYGSSTTSTSYVTAHSVALSGLTPSTTYHFQVTSGDALNNYATSTDYTFTTSAPTVSTAPQSLSATANISQVSLSWTAPSSNGGSAITDYFYEYKQTASSTWNSFPHTATTTTSATITGLTNAISHDFRISAINGVGTSTASNIVSSTPYTTPGVPTGVSATASSTKATITFTTPSSNGGSAILYYTVTSNPGSLTATSSATSITVTNLTNGTAYTFTVTATNIAGTSASSSASNSVTPVGNYYYIDYVNGNDANNGTSKSTPWQRAPGMSGCSGNCAAYQTSHPSPTATTGAGDQFIFKGGVTLPRAALSWDWIYGSGTSNNPIYFGVDTTWYTGTSWSRPILDAQSGVPNYSGNTYAMFRAYGDGFVVDNFEFKGLAQLDDVNTAPCMLSVGTGGSASSQGIEVKNNYFHGWSHGGTATRDYMITLQSVLWSSPDMNLKIYNNVWDGSDTTNDMGMAYKGSAGHFYNNYVGKMQNGLVVGQIKYVWGNTFEEIATSADFDLTSHHQSLEENNGQTIFYNNFIKNSGGGGTVLTYGMDNLKDYIFNNVIIGDGNQILQLGTKNGSSVTLVTGTGYEMHVFNNTLQSYDGNNSYSISGPTLTDAALMPLMEVRNNHLIGPTHAVSFGTGVAAAGKVESNTFGQTNTAATSAGYVSSSASYPYYPPQGGSTIGAGYDLTSFCSTIPSSTTSNAASACLSDTTLGVNYNSASHTVNYPKRAAFARTAWDVGAYQYIPPYYISPGTGSDSNTGTSTASSWQTISKFMLYPGMLTPTTGTATSSTQITFNTQLQITLSNGTIITVPANTQMSASSTIDFSQTAASSNVSASDIPSGYTSAGVVSFGHPQYSMTSNQSVTIRIPVDSSYNGRTLTIFRKEPGGSSWINTNTTCVASNAFCQFTATTFSEFSASVQNSSSTSGPSSSTPVSYGGDISYQSQSTSTTSNNTSTSNNSSSTANNNSSSISLKNIQQTLTSLINQLKSLLSQALSLTTRNLKPGSKGNGVKMLQTYLILQNTGPASQALSKHGTTSSFGILTKNALTEFQKANNIHPASGIFGPITRNYIKTR